MKQNEENRKDKERKKGDVTGKGDRVVVEEMFLSILK